VALPVISPNDEARRDFDYAMKIGTKEAWDAFLAAHPTGFYANLGHGERAKRLTAAAPGTVAPPSAAQRTPAEIARDPKLDQKTALRHEPDTRTRSLTPRHEPEIGTRSLTPHDTEKPAARKKERATRSGSRSGGGGACGYVRRAVRAGTAAGLDNGVGLIAFGRSICGG
jgi:hypothetical protein